MKKITPALIIFLAIFVFAPSAMALSLVDNIPCAASGEKCNVCHFLTLFVNGADIIAGLAGSLSLVMLVTAGVAMITAYGNQNRIQWGKDIITATLTGIIIVFFAWSLVNIFIKSLGLSGNVGENWYNSSGICSKQETS